MYNSASKSRRFENVLVDNSNKIHHGLSFESSSQPTLSHCQIQYDSLRLDTNHLQGAAIGVLNGGVNE
jgi:hypothetical protein